MDNELIKFILDNNFDAKSVQAHLEYWVDIYGCDDTNALLLEYSESISNEVIAQMILFSENCAPNKCDKHLQIIVSRCKAPSEDLKRQKLLDRVKEILNR